jgi:hypothetical protein
MVEQWKVSGYTRPVGGTRLGAAGADGSNTIDTAVTHIARTGKRRDPGSRAG